MHARTRVTARSVHPTRLPRSVRPGLWSSADWPLLACMLTVGLVLLGGVVYLDLIYRPARRCEVSEQEWLPIPTTPRRETRLVRRLHLQGEPPVPREPRRGSTARRERAHSRRGPLSVGALKRQVDRLGVLRLLGHKGGGRLTDLLDRGSPDGRLARAFTGLDGTLSVDASRRPVPGLRGRGDEARAVDIDGLGRVSGPGLQRTGGAVRERVPTPEVRTDPRTFRCPWPVPNVMPVVRRGLPAIRACYERQLRREPGLEGKLALRFHIDLMGRVQELEVIQDSLEQPLVSGCIVSHARRWRFPPAERDAEVTVPLVLKPGR